MIVDTNGAYSAPSVTPVTMAAVAPPAGGPSIAFGMRAPRFYYDALVPADADAMWSHGAAVPVAVDLVRVKDGVAVAHWDLAPARRGSGNA